MARPKAFLTSNYMPARSICTLQPPPAWLTTPLFLLIRPLRPQCGTDYTHLTLRRNPAVGVRKEEPMVVATHDFPTVSQLGLLGSRHTVQRPRICKQSCCFQACWGEVGPILGPWGLLSPLTPHLSLHVPVCPQRACHGADLLPPLPDNAETQQCLRLCHWHTLGACSLFRMCASLQGNISSLPTQTCMK